MSRSLTQTFNKFAFLFAAMPRWSTRLGASRATILRPGDSSYIAPLVEPPGFVSVILPFRRNRCVGRQYREVNMFSEASGTASLLFLGLRRPGNGCKCRGCGSASFHGSRQEEVGHFYRCYPLLLLEGLAESAGPTQRNTPQDVRVTSIVRLVCGCSGWFVDGNGMKWLSLPSS